MRRLMKEAGLPEPKFNTQGFFTVTFMKRGQANRANDDRLNGTLYDTLNGTLKLVLDLIKTSPGITANTLILQTDKSVRTIRRAVKYLIENGLIEYRGSKKTGGYYPL